MIHGFKPKWISILFSALKAAFEHWDIIRNKWPTFSRWCEYSWSYTKRLFSIKHEVDIKDKHCVRFLSIMISCCFLSAPLSCMMDRSRIDTDNLVCGLSVRMCFLQKHGFETAMMTNLQGNYTVLRIRISWVWRLPLLQDTKHISWLDTPALSVTPVCCFLDDTCRTLLLFSETPAVPMQRLRPHAHLTPWGLYLADEKK